MSTITNIDIDNTLNLLDKEDYGVVMDKLLEFAQKGNAELVHQRLNTHGEYSQVYLFYQIDGWIYRQMGDKESALKSYEKSYELNPTKESLTDIFDCHFWTGRYEEALSIAEKIVEEYGNSHKILIVKTQLRLLTPQDQLKLVEESLADILSFENPFAEETLALKGANICYDLGLYEKAYEMIQRSIATCYKHKPGPVHSQTLYKIIVKLNRKKERR